MVELEKLKKAICSNKPVSVDHLKQFSEKLKDDAATSSIANDLPKLLPSILKYAFHEDKNISDAATPAFIELTNVLDLNKHLKGKPWWPDMKDNISKSVNILMELLTSGHQNWSDLWCTTVMLMGTDLRTELAILNKLLKVVEKAFKMNQEDVRIQGFECWCKLIDNFAINKQDLNSRRRLNLLVIPLKASNHTTTKLHVSKMQTWKYLLSKIDQHNEMTIQLLISSFLEFMFVGVGTISPTCKVLNKECADVFSQMLKTPSLFRVLPEQFIKYTFTCIESVCNNLSLSMSLWNLLIGNMKYVQWSENLVLEIFNCLNHSVQSASLEKSKVIAQIIHSLCSGPQALQHGLLIKHSSEIFSMALIPHILVHFSDAWCSDLFDIIDRTDPVLLPKNILGTITNDLADLTNSLSGKDKMQILRGIWMIINNILCKWMSNNDQVGKNGSLQTDMHTAQVLLSIGAAHLSPMWNKSQMKAWKTLYSDCVKYFSLLPEGEKFVNGLVGILLGQVQKTNIPLHVAVDVVCIILEFHLSKDVSSILPLMIEVAESGVNSLPNDISGLSASLTQYVKAIVVAARREPALVVDVMTVIEKMCSLLQQETFTVGVQEKTRNTILKAQLQLQALKPGRTQDKSDSPGNTQPQTAPSPTMTSFLHRLAKAKETKNKMVPQSPTQSSSGSSSPGHTPNSKKAMSPFADLNSQDFVFVPPKTRKTVLTDHQKESLCTRKHDIPALYQDLSQDSSQSALDSIVTSLKNKEEDGDKIKVLHSPKKKCSNSLKIDLKITTPKPALDSNKNTENTKLNPNEQSLVDKENNLTNNNSKSLSLASAKQIIDIQAKEEIMKAKLNQNGSKKSLDKYSETDCITETFKSNNNFRGCKKDNFLKSDSEESVHEISTDERENSKLSCNKSSTQYSKNTVKVGGPKKYNLESSQSKLNTPDKKSLQRDKIIISAKKCSKKKIDPDCDDSIHSTNASPSNRKSTCGSSGTPKISPRRLRKRKSGVTPILSGGKLVKKSKLSATQNSTEITTTEKSLIEVIQIDDEEIVEKNNQPPLENVSDIKKIIEPPIDKHKSIIVEPPSLLNTMQEKLNIALGRNETCKSKEKNIHKENIKDSPNKILMLSPVKVVLSRIDHLSGVQFNIEKRIGESCILSDGRQKEVGLSSEICSNAKKILTDDHEGIMESSTKNVGADAPFDKLYLKGSLLETQKENTISKNDIVPSTKNFSSPEDERHNKSLKDKTVKEAQTPIQTVTTKLIESSNKYLKSENISNCLNKSNKLKAILPKLGKEQNPEMCNRSLSSRASRSSELIRLSLASSKTADVSIDENNSPNKLSCFNEKSPNKSILLRSDLPSNKHTIAQDFSSSINKSISASVNTTSMEQTLPEYNLSLKLPNINALSSEKHLLTCCNTLCKSNDKTQTETVQNIEFHTKSCLSENDKLANERSDNNSAFSCNMDSLENGEKEIHENISIECNTISAENSSMGTPVLVLKDATEMSLNYEETIMEYQPPSDIKNKLSPQKSNSKFESKSFLNFHTGTSVNNADSKIPSSSMKSPKNKNLFNNQGTSNVKQSEESGILHNNKENITLLHKKVDEFAVEKNDCSDTSDIQCRNTSLTKSSEISVHQNLNVSTPIKSGQKNLKQTQLPFTPIQKFSESTPKNAEPENDSKTCSNKCTVSSKANTEGEVSSPFLMLEKINISEYVNKSCSSNHKDNLKDYCGLENQVEIVNDLKQQTVTSGVDNDNGLNVPRTPEKVAVTTINYCKNESKVGLADVVIMESPVKLTESEDIIASSQENEPSNGSFIISDRASLLCTKSPPKLLSKSPKKVDYALFSQHSATSSERVLKSSPLKISPRPNSTPIKKSVCRRLDVEIDESIPTTIEQNIAGHNIRSSPMTITNKTEATFKEAKKSSSDEWFCEMKFLSGNNKNNNLKNDDNTCPTFKDSVGSQFNESNENDTPSNSSKLCQMEPNVGLVESPMVVTGTSRFDGVDSPKSPSSRTNQMMELAMQEKEKILSSPSISAQKRRILPVRIGPIKKTPQSQSRFVNVTSPSVSNHSGPSEEWVRRTYSPSASPNSSILKRKFDVSLTSPESSPPSVKKKRVSFLDPPVSESLIFCKANPGKGQIHRSDQKRDCESEEVPSQGSVQLELFPTNSGSDTMVYSPLKNCSNSLTDVLERIASLQWASELEAQLERLDVTTVGQLSSLTEATIERLPFIPPKVTRLRKILQNYYNEVNEKCVDKDECKPQDHIVNAEDELETIVQTDNEINTNESHENNQEGHLLDAELSESREIVSSLADKLKNDIQLHPDLIDELGSRLSIDTIMEILKCAVTKLKNKNDER